MKRLIEIAGDLRFAFRLILISGAVMWTGSIYSSMHYSFINSMNGVPLIEWFMSKGMENISITWWIPVMFFIFLLLGINTLACTLNRMAVLVPRRKILGTKRFLVLVSPSVIHILFMAMLAGHFLSFTAVTQQKIPVAEGDKIFVNGIGEISVVSITNEFFQDSSLMAQRIKQTRAAISIDADGVKTDDVVSFLEPVLASGSIIQLDMEKKKENMIVKPLAKDETCNKEKKFHYSENTTQVNPQLFFLITKDPGLFILLPGFFIVILLMGWYFYQTNFLKMNKEYMDNENEIGNV
jgi:hypothetical protein